jgi:hypothetical protein
MYNKMSGKKDNITFSVAELKKRGRPRKYDTPEEARQMKIKKTIEAQKRRSGGAFNPLPEFKEQVESAENGSLTGGHWTTSMTPHLENELRNYKNIAHHLGSHLKEKGKKDPKDVAGFKHFTKEAEKIEKLLSDVKSGGSFFGNIGNAFKTSWNKPVQSKAEGDALKFFYNDFLPVATTPIKALAPPVGAVASVGFDALRKHQGV